MLKADRIFIYNQGYAEGGAGWQNARSDRPSEQIHPGGGLP